MNRQEETSEKPWSPLVPPAAGKLAVSGDTAYNRPNFVRKFFVGRVTSRGAIRLSQRSQHASPAQRGTSFTLVELAIVLTIILIILTIAVPQFKNLTGGSRLQSATRQVYEALNQARVNAITTRKRTRIFFPVAGATNTTLIHYAPPSPGSPVLYTTAELAPYLCQTYIIADWSYDNGNYVWMARTAWNFLPKGTVFEHNAAAVTIGSGASCVLITGGNTLFASLAGGPDYVSYFPGASNATADQTVGLGNYAYVEFKPTGASTTSNMLKIDEGFYPNSGSIVTFTNVNASGGPVNYSLIVTDTLTGRLRVLRPGGPDGGCGP